MSYKTILVHLNSSARAPAAVRCAVAIGQRQQAHLIGLHTSLDNVYAVAGIEFSAQLLEQLRETQAKEAHDVKAAFERGVASLSDAAYEFRVEARDQPDALFDEVVRQGRCADLIIADGDPSTDPLSAWSDMPIRLIMEAGRPVLLAPPGYSGSVEAEHILVAWSGTRESARAAFDALPLLRNAANVTVLTVLPGDASGDARLLSAQEFGRALNRHGVKAEVKATSAAGKRDAECLLSGLDEFGCDALVMGAYGHSRFREMIFGGVTKYVLNNMTVPVLVSH